MHVAGPQQAAVRRGVQGLTPGGRQGSTEPFAAQERAIKIGGKSGAISVMNDTEGANVVLRASQQKGAANPKRLALIQALGLPARGGASLTGVGKDQHGR